MASNCLPIVPPDTFDCLHHYNSLKAKGNDLFRAGQWRDAIAEYESALRRLPARKTSTFRNEESRNQTDIESDIGESDGSTSSRSHEADQCMSLSETEEHVKARAVLHANIGACYQKLGDHKQVVDSCSRALLDDPKYVKALQRRAASSESINSWSSLTTAQEDYTLLLTLLPPSSSQGKEAECCLSLLKPRVETAQKRETAEMLDKLKGLGNTVLGKFGLSTDNFKFEPNGQGGYSVNFSR